MLGWRVVLPILKRVVPLGALVRLMWSDRRLPTGIDREAVIRLAEVVYKPGSPPGTRGNCLERSLVAYRYLARARAVPVLVVGFDRPGGGVRGHVWVLVEGQPVHDRAEFVARRTPLVSFGEGGRRVSPIEAGAPQAVQLTDA
jgi:hypothetical protein